MILASLGALAPGLLAQADLLALPTALVGVVSGALVAVGVFCPLIRLPLPVPSRERPYCFGAEAALGSL